jgi:hypothetical protein
MKRFIELFSWMVIWLAATTDLVVAAEQKSRPFGVDMSIESMSSKEFSVGIFFFLIVAILIFVGITVMYMFKDKGKRLKTGEKWMFAWILFGVVVAVIFGAVQLMDGYLF